MSADAQVRHAAFYAACQALLYVLCYHMEPLLRPRAKQQAEGGAGGARGAAAGGGEQHQQHQQQQGAAGGTPSSSMGLSGGTPNGSLGPSGGTPSSMRSHRDDRRDALHAQVCWLLGGLRVGC